MDPSTDVAEDNRLRTLIGNLLESESMSDVDFLVDQPPHRFPCHKLVLGLGSQVFKAMFYGKIREQDEIRVPDVSQEGFTIMLRQVTVPFAINNSLHSRAKTTWPPVNNELAHLWRASTRLGMD
ncbi:hypothetical protein CDAR_281051 [Caerostris darwini]|uniref:BTB domain-containing protein n=1 Tax=Caerostris darwini TaxID=1538125 RepID=A0AAV4VB27_9ARAC|nr:hypothetical protein CDAR_281051 [Caerostris darwini]